MAFIQTERGEYMRKKLTAVLLAATMLLTSGVIGLCRPRGCRDQ